MKNFELPKSDFLLKELESEGINYTIKGDAVIITDDCTISDIYDLGCIVTRAERNSHWETPEVLTYNTENAKKFKQAITKYEKNSMRNVNSISFKEIGRQTEITFKPTYAGDLISIGMYYERQFEDKKETV